MAWLQGIYTIRLNHRHRRQVSQHHFGELRLETAQAKAERIISEELVRFGLAAGGAGITPQARPGQTGNSRAPA
jgi:hypothetical protein